MNLACMCIVPKLWVFHSYKQLGVKPQAFAICYHKLDSSLQTLTYKNQLIIWQVFLSVSIPLTYVKY